MQIHTSTPSYRQTHSLQEPQKYHPHSSEPKAAVSLLKARWLIPCTSSYAIILTVRGSPEKILLNEFAVVYVHLFGLRDL